MSTVLLNYAVSFNQIASTNAANLAFLHQLGIVTKPAAAAPTVTVTAPGEGTTTVPAVIELTGLFQAGDIVDATFTDDLLVVNQVPYTVLETMSASDVAVQWAALIDGLATMSAEAVGSTIEVVALAPSITVEITAPIYTPIGAPFEPSIITVTDPEELAYYTDKGAEISGAFDGGLTRIYLILVESIDQVPALILEKECDFFFTYDSDFRAYNGKKIKIQNLFPCLN